MKNIYQGLKSKNNRIANKYLKKLCLEMYDDYPKDKRIRKYMIQDIIGEIEYCKSEWGGYNV